MIKILILKVISKGKKNRNYVRSVRTVSTVIVLVYNCTSIGHGSMSFAACMLISQFFIHADALVFIDSIRVRECVFFFVPSWNLCYAMLECCPSTFVCMSVMLI